MALDRNYFNSIKLDPIKRKYYDIYAVDNLLVDIRRQAELMNHRYEELRAELEARSAEKEDCRKKGQILSEEIVTLRATLKEAEQRAASAEEKAAAAEQKLSETAERGKTTDGTYNMKDQPDLVEEMYESMKKIYASGLQTLEEQWQEYLENSNSKVPEDLSSKISKIANALQEINEENS